MRAVAATIRSEPSYAASQARLHAQRRRFRLDQAAKGLAFNESLGCGIRVAVCSYSRLGVAEDVIAKMTRHVPGKTGR